MNFKNIFLLFGVLFLKVNFAQQDPMQSMYMQDKMLVNPAFAGSSNWVVGTLKYRNNVTGFNGQYSTQTLNFHAPIQAKHIGIGFKLVNDKRAILTNMNVAADLSYHLNFAKGKLSLGIEGGIYNRKINYDKLILAKHGDQVIPLNAQSSLVPDVSFGVFYQRKQFYMGYAMYHLIKTEFDKKTIQNSASHLYGHNYLLLGNVFDISKNWAIEPSMLLKYQAQSQVQLDINTMIIYNDKISAGLQYRTGSALLATVKYNITENFKIAYAYDHSISKFSQYGNGAHEIVISYGIKLPPPPSKKEIHPRYYF